jgi:hypothetical protein
VGRIVEILPGHRGEFGYISEQQPDAQAPGTLAGNLVLALAEIAAKLALEQGIE